MSLLARRALVIGGLVVLYALSPLMGIAALVSGFSYLLWSRFHRPRLLLD
jgi:hypothetical protein